jgi:hypothetical protein
MLFRAAGGYRSLSSLDRLYFVSNPKESSSMSDDQVEKMLDYLRRITNALEELVKKQTPPQPRGR